jgi:hypothetical protein
MDDISREELYHALGTLSKSIDVGFANINNRLDRLNGDVRDHGTDIAVLKVSVAQAGERGKDPAARWSAVGVGLGTVATAVWQWVTR